MLDKIINRAEESEKLKQETQKATYEKEKAERERILQMDTLRVSLFEKLEAYFDEKKANSQLPRIKDEIITIGYSGFVFDAQGYKYASLLVGTQDGSEVLQFEYKGVRWSLTLKEGMNQFVAPNGTKISKTGNDISAVLVRHSFTNN